MSASLSSAVADLQRVVASNQSAWARWRDTAANARCAAVMGSAILANLRSSGGWTVDANLDRDATLSKLLAESAADHPGLREAVRAHIEWLLWEIEDSMVHAMTLDDPRFTLDEHVHADRDLASSHELARLNAEMDSKLKAIVAEAEILISTRGVAGMSISRKRIIDTHNEQVKVIVEKASELAFSDVALAEVQSAINALKRPGVDPRAVYKGSRYTDLQDERKRIETDRDETVDG